jgi:hypothetical protein
MPAHIAEACEWLQAAESSAGELAVLTGLEPATSALTGNRTSSPMPSTCDFVRTPALCGTNNPRAHQNFVP